MTAEIRKLEKAAEEIATIARRLGLDYYPVHFEICPPETLYSFGAYGMPVRFNHWSFGKAFYRLKTQYDLNLSRIYELVINANPAYAFLLEGNSLVQNKLVIAHVFAHVDFFKNNRYFERTPKDMVERMATHAERIRGYEIVHGREKVEKTLDAVLSIQEHVDPRAHIGKAVATNSASTPKRITHKYGDLLQLEEQAEHEAEDRAEERTKQERTAECEDLLYYVMEYAPELEEWQRDIIGMVREEALYFYPQIETKITNEGWATFWHCKIMRELDLSASEAIDFAVNHSRIVQPTTFALNPYYLGFKIWEHLEKKYSLPELFEFREIENDISFIRNHLNQELVEELNLFNYRKLGATWQVTETHWENVRDNLVKSLYNGGNPKIVAVDGDYDGKRMLYLRHVHEGVDLDVYYLEKTLALVGYLWGKGVILETILDNKKVLFECNHGSVTRKYLSNA